MNIESIYSSAAFWLALIATCVALAAIAFSFRTTSFRAIFTGFLVVLFGTAAIRLLSMRLFNLSEEKLHLPILLALLVFGLLSGVLLAMITRRVAFFEALSVAALMLWIPTVPSQLVTELLSEGTAAAYFVALLLAAYLVLLVALLLGGALGYLFFGDGKLSLSFSYESLMGRRFLMAQRSSHAVSLITVISVFAVTVGCMGMIVVMSIMNGFGDDIRKKIVGSNAHLMVMKYGKDFNEYDEVIKKTKRVQGITGASPFILSEVMISSDINLTGAIIKGIDIASVGQVTELPRNIIDGKLASLDDPKKIPKLKKRTSHSEKDDKRRSSEVDALEQALAKASQDSEETEPTLPGIIIGQEMARALKVFVGDVLNVVSPIGELGPAGPIPKARAFRVAGVFYTGMYEYDSKFVYVALKEAQSFFGLKGSVTGIEYKTSDVEKTKNIGQQVRKLLGGYPYYTKDWMQMNHSLFSALKLEKIAMFLILIVIILMASLLILVALVLVVIEKSKEIAILKSMGASDSSIMKIFVTYGVLIGGFGMAIGIALGLGVCLLIQTFGIGLDPEVYYISHLPVKVEWVEVMLVAVSALVVSFLATVPPSLFAARMRPVEGLRR